MAILKSKSGYSYDTETGVKTNPDGTSGTVNSKIDTPLSTNDLQNTTKYDLPSKPIDTSTNTLNSMTSSVAKNAEQNYQDEIAKIKEQSSGDTNAIANLMKEISGTEGQVSNVAEQYGATENLKKYRKLTTDIAMEDEKTRQAIERIQRENPQGALRGGQADLIKNIERESSNRKAVMAIHQSAALGDYNTALDIAKTKVETDLAPKKAELEALKYTQERNDKFQTAEMNLVVKKMENEIDREEKEKDNIATLLATAAKYEAPVSILNQISNAKTYKDAVILGAKYLIDPIERRAKLADIASKEASNSVAKAINSLDPTSSTYTIDMIKSSKGGKALTGEQTTPISKGLTVVSQIGSLQNTLNGQNTGPIVGILRSNNPYDTKAKLISAQLQSLVPNLARGVYGEVGVLTDQDIQNYTKTLGNIKTSEEANNLLLSMTLKTIKNSLDNQFQVMAASGRDVSGFEGIYNNLQTKINTLDNNLGVYNVSNTTNNYLDEKLGNTSIGGISNANQDWISKFIFKKQ